jgi:uncharacterized membrane protein YdfJ with MMPL/SSD domain
VAIDFSNVLAGKLPLFVVVIVVLAFVLLAAVFRSLLVPLMASVMNILSIGAALAAITAAFQFGWLKKGISDVVLAPHAPLAIGEVPDTGLDAFARLYELNLARTR